MTLNNNQRHDDQPDRARSIRTTTPTGRRRIRSRCCATSRSTTHRQQLVVTKLNQDISEIQLQATIINTLSNVRNAYWDYVFAVQSVEVAPPVGRARRSARRRQPDARGSRDDGADRCHPGAIAGGHPAAEPGPRGRHAPDQRADPEAADRQRHAGSELERIDRSDRSARVRA